MDQQLFRWLIEIFLPRSKFFANGNNSFGDPATIKWNSVSNPFKTLLPFSALSVFFKTMVQLKNKLPCILAAITLISTTAEAASATVRGVAPESKQWFLQFFETKDFFINPLFLHRVRFI